MEIQIPTHIFYYRKFGVFFFSYHIMITKKTHKQKKENLMDPGLL